MKRLMRLIALIVVLLLTIGLTESVVFARGRGHHRSGVTRSYRGSYRGRVYRSHRSYIRRPGFGIRFYYYPRYYGGYGYTPYYYVYPYCD